MAESAEVCHELEAKGRFLGASPLHSVTTVDPFGQPWSIATHVEDLTPDEMYKRMQAGCAPAQSAAKA